MNWAANIHKYQRAFALSATKEEADVKRIYIQMGGLIKPGYETVEAVEKTAELPKQEETTVPEEMTVLEQPAPKKRGRPKKNA